MGDDAKAVAEPVLKLFKEGFVLLGASGARTGDAMCVVGAAVLPYMLVRFATSPARVDIREECEHVAAVLTLENAKHNARLVGILFHAVTPLAATLADGEVVLTLVTHRTGT
jgi:hypothetical protein